MRLLMPLLALHPLLRLPIQLSSLAFTWKTTASPRGLMPPFKVSGFISLESASSTAYQIEPQHPPALQL